jgi:hypothetical protein
VHLRPLLTHAELDTAPKAFDVMLPLSLLQKRMNLTKTIRKTPVDLNLETAGTTYVDPGLKQQPKYDDEDKWVRDAAVFVIWRRTS